MSFILYQGYKQRGAYILTQAPLDNTIEDFWCMISQYEIGTIVMLNSLKEGKEVDVSSYIIITLKLASSPVMVFHFLGHTQTHTKKRKIALKHLAAANY